jgi:hypothetical protein
MMQALIHFIYNRIQIFDFMQEFRKGGKSPARNTNLVRFVGFDPGLTDTGGLGRLVGLCWAGSGACAWSEGEAGWPVEPVGSKEIGPRSVLFKENPS